MLRGLHTATSGMIAQQRRQDALSHNLANMNTPGYKNDQSVIRSFPEMLLYRLNGGKEGMTRAEELSMLPSNIASVGSLNTGVYHQELIPNFAMGNLIETGKNHDFAIVDGDLTPTMVDGRPVKPAIFFAVQTPQGDTQYTRNGNFTVDAMGRLVTSDGALVLNPQGNPVEVDENGEVSLDQLGLVRIDNPQQLIRRGSNLYEMIGNDQPNLLPEGDWNGFSIKQGFVEGANVDPGQTITDMMVTMRSYESNQKVIQAYDRTMELLNSVGRLG